MNSTNPGVTWSVNGVPGGNATVGTVDATGLYTAPQNLPMPAAVTVRATSVADPSRSATATATVTSDVAVNVAPAPAMVELGASQNFSATVTGSGNPNRAVTWSVNGLTGGNAITGTIDVMGVYTAPSILPSPAGVNIAATSVADPSKAGSAATTVTSNFMLAVSGPASVDNGQTAQFSAQLTPVPGSNPDLRVNWSLSGAGCGVPGACGTMDAAGFYTAPQVAPFPSGITVTATSVADPTRFAMQAVNINAIVTVRVSPAGASVHLEAMQQFAATVAGTVNPNVTWDINGIVGGDQATVGAISQTGMYFAPVNMPAARQVTIRATSQAQPAVSDGVPLFLSGTNILLSLAPASEARAVNRRLQLQLQVAGTSNQMAELRVNGIPGGDAASGMLCVSGSNLCLTIATGQNGEIFDYIAPASIPANPTVTVAAVSLADGQRSASATVQVLASISVNLSPQNISLPPVAAQVFTALLTGTPSREITWDVNGVANGDLGVGQVCVVASNPCQAPAGAVSNVAEYRAPATAPVPPSVTLRATSVEDPAQMATANIGIRTGPFITGLVPASVTAGAASAILLRVTGSGFAPTMPGPGSTIAFNGISFSTTCLSSAECTANIAAAEVAAAATRTVQVLNPGMPPVPSNQVDFVVLEMVTAEEVIALTAGAPVAAGKDIRVAEAATAAQPSPGLQINTVGLFVANSCNPQPGAIAVTRPASGAVNAQICVIGDNLTIAQAYRLSGPQDITVTGTSQLGTNLVLLSLAIPSNAQRGARTLFVENSEKERAAASGAIEVK